MTKEFLLGSLVSLDFNMNECAELIDQSELGVHCLCCKWFLIRNKFFNIMRAEPAVVVLFSYGER